MLQNNLFFPSCRVEKKLGHKSVANRKVTTIKEKNKKDVACEAGLL